MKILSYLLFGVLILGGVALTIGISVLWVGFVLSILWGWFMVPTLGLPAISVLQAAGITIVIRYFTVQFDAENYINDDKDTDKFKKIIAAGIFSVLYPLFALGIGWVIHIFM